MSGQASSGRRRFARRSRSRRRALWWRLLTALLAVGLVAGAAWLVFFSSVLAVQRVEVGGTRTVSADAVSTAAAVPLGRPLARVDVDAVRRRLDDMRVIERVDVGRAWPDTVTIDVTERTPVAAVADGGSYELVDAAGVRFRTVPTPPRRLPVLLVGGDERVEQEAAAVTASLPDRLAGRVVRVRADTMDSITLALRGGRTVVWGSAADSELKADVLGALLARRGRADGGVYDVSVPGAPTVKVG